MLTRELCQLSLVELNILIKQSLKQWMLFVTYKHYWIEHQPLEAIFKDDFSLVLKEKGRNSSHLLLTYKEINMEVVEDQNIMRRC